MNSQKYSAFIMTQDFISERHTAPCYVSRYVQNRFKGLIFHAISVKKACPFSKVFYLLNSLIS